MEAVGRMLLMAGTLLIVGGLLVLLAARVGFPLGRLPGDLAWRGRHGALLVPLGTSLLLSLVLSLFFWLLGRFHR